MFVLDALLASVLPQGEPDRNERQRDRNYEQLQPIPERLPAELSKRPRLAALLLSRSLFALILRHDRHDNSAGESTMNQELAYRSHPRRCVMRTWAKRCRDRVANLAPVPRDALSGIPMPTAGCCRQR